MSQKVTSKNQKEQKAMWQDHSGGNRVAITGVPRLTQQWDG